MNHPNSVSYLTAGQIINNLRGFVGAAVVDYDDLSLESIIGECLKSISDSPGDILLLIQSGHNDGKIYDAFFLFHNRLRKVPRIVSPITFISQLIMAEVLISDTR